jgi:D-ribose pyranose/furanose isomerase RbsD
MGIKHNPILSKEEIGGWRIFQKRPIPDPGTALVLSGEGQPLLTIKQGNNGITSGEIRWGKYNSIYKIDVTDFPLNFQCILPCATDAFDFKAEVKFTCSVKDPEIIIQRNITDIGAVLEPLIIEVMRRISRKYQVEDSGAAELAISNSIKQAIYDEGFNIPQLVITLSLEEEARKRIREVKRLQEEVNIEKERQALELQKEKLAIEKRKLQEEFERESTSLQNQFSRSEEISKLQDEFGIEKMKQTLEMQRTQFEIYQLKMKEEFALEMMKQKTEMYTSMLQAGQWQQFALLLNQTGDVSIVMNILNEQKQSEREHQVKMLKMLLDADALEGGQVNEVGKGFLRQLIGLTEESKPLLASESVGDSTIKEVLIEEDNPISEVSTDIFPEELRRQ